MRIGIAVKPGLSAARDTLIDLEQRLRERGVDAVWSTDAAALFDGAPALAGSGPARGARATAERKDLPSQVDVVIVLGGDGTLLATAKTIAEGGHDIPILAVNFGSLGFLTEITRPEIYQSLDAVISGRATHDLRMMLRASAVCTGWMAGYGVRFQPSLGGTLHLGRTNAFFLGGGKALLNTYYAAAERLGIRVLYDARVAASAHAYAL